MEMVTIHCSTRYKNIGVRQAVDLAVFCRSATTFEGQSSGATPYYTSWKVTANVVPIILSLEEVGGTQDYKHEIKGGKKSGSWLLHKSGGPCHEGVDGLGPHDVLGQAVPATDALGQEGLMVVLSPALKLRVLLVCGRACSDYGAG